MGISIIYSINYSDKIIVKLLNYLTNNYPNIKITLLKLFDYKSIYYCLKINKIVRYESIHINDNNLIFNNSIKKINYYLK
jgi:hypothetical protein